MLCSIHQRGHWYVPLISVSARPPTVPPGNNHWCGSSVIIFLSHTVFPDDCPSKGVFQNSIIVPKTRCLLPMCILGTEQCTCTLARRGRPQSTLCERIDTLNRLRDIPQVPVDNSILMHIHIIMYLICSCVVLVRIHVIRWDRTRIGIKSDVRESESCVSPRTPTNTNFKRATK